MKSIMVIAQTSTTDKLTTEANYRLLKTLQGIAKRPLLLAIGFKPEPHRVVEGAMTAEIPSNTFKVAKFVLKMHHDIFLFWYGGHRIMVLPILLLKLLRRQAKIIIRIDGTGSAVHRGNGKWLLSFIHSCMEWIIFSCADIIACQYKELAVDCRLRRYNHKLQLANQYVDTEVFSSKVDWKDRYYDLAYCGRFDNNKGIMEFLSAVDHLQNEMGMELKVVVAGDGGLFRDVGDYVAKHNLPVDFVGRQPIEVIAGIMSNSRFLVIPSHMEGVPKVAIEAMACGCIPIASHAGGLKYLVRHWCTGFTIQKITTDGIANAILAALRCPIGRIQEILVKYQGIIIDYSFDTIQRRYQQMIGFSTNVVV